MQGSSTPYVEVAKQVGVSDTTLHARIRHLLNSGIINKFTISINNNRLGFSHVAFDGVNIEPGYAQEVVNNISDIDEILEMHEIMGRFDLLLKLRTRNLDQMRDILVNSIRKCPRIVEVKFMAMLKTTKEEQNVYPTFLEGGERP
jgi:Lrp/AsnC family transcriptional regulator, regulator for asnA, asnC and gidA